MPKVAKAARGAAPRVMKGKIHFDDTPEFTPTLSPAQIFQAGAFGGTYWRPIKSKVTKKEYKDAYKEFPASWWKGLKPAQHLTRKWEDYDPAVNKYGTKVGASLEEWESSGWIAPADPYGWIQWYCRFYEGRRTADDARQISRWKNMHGRFMKRLIRMLLEKKKSHKDVADVSPAIAQTLLHWGIVITAADMKLVKI
ncbi:hypothetical protein DIPPA_28233 [Diplonema papillatum]|nr:hypothetical protein DIPPA_28233 [Diplonema papillatum]KAJ9442475.1 hypothetical protein DIPPA_28233 [Diplonema papillatum]